MTEDERKKIINDDRIAQSARDREAFDRLRTYYRLNFTDGASDKAFLKWCEAMTKQAAQEWLCRLSHE